MKPLVSYFILEGARCGVDLPVLTSTSCFCVQVLEARVEHQVLQARAEELEKRAKDDEEV